MTRQFPISRRAGRPDLFFQRSGGLEFEKLVSDLSGIRKTFYRFELLWELLRQASLHNEAVQDSWTALYFGWDVGSRLGQWWKGEPLRVDFHPAALDRETAFREEADREGKVDVFLFQDA